MTHNIRQSSNIPVDPDSSILFEPFRLLSGGELPALGCILLTEPEWALKVKTGVEETIRDTIPATDADHLLTLPQPLYARLLSVPGRLPISG